MLTKTSPEGDPVMEHARFILEVLLMKDALKQENFDLVAKAILTPELSLAMLWLTARPSVFFIDTFPFSQLDTSFPYLKLTPSTDYITDLKLLNFFCDMSRCFSLPQIVSEQIYLAVNFLLTDNSTLCELSA